MLNQVEYRSNFAGLKANFSIPQGGYVLDQDIALKKQYINTVNWIIELVLRSKFEFYDETKSFTDFIQKKVERGQLKLVEFNGKQSIVFLPSLTVLLSLEGMETRFNPATHSTKLYINYRAHRDPLYYNTITERNQDR